MPEGMNICMLCDKDMSPAGEPMGQSMLDPNFRMGVCPQCRADARLGKAVRAMPKGYDLRHINWSHPTPVDKEWAVDDGEGHAFRPTFDTPEAALAAAGLMEEEG